MDNTQCPHELVPLAHEILLAFRETTNIPGKSNDFKEGYFGHMLSLILRDYNTETPDE